MYDSRSTSCQFYVITHDKIGFCIHVENLSSIVKFIHFIALPVMVSTTDQHRRHLIQQITHSFISGSARHTPARTLMEDQYVRLLIAQAFDGCKNLQCQVFILDKATLIILYFPLGF
jgi:hypothetical protein